MNCFERHSKIFLWMMALLLSFILSGCGSGGGGDSVGTGSSGGPGPVAGAPNSIAPGTSPTGATGAASSTAVTASTPTNNATHVAIGVVGSDNVPTPRTITATFSEAMNPATLSSPAQSFTVKETVSGTGVSGVVTMNADNTLATFTPSALLHSNTQFTAIVTTAAISTAGTALNSNYGWSFTTGSQIGQTPINLGAAAAFTVLGGTSITNDSVASDPTRVNGQLGITSGLKSSVTGFADSTPAGTGLISTGGIQIGSTVNQASTDLLTALSGANARTSNQVLVGTNDMATFMVNGGSPGVFPPGLYTSGSSLRLSSGNMTLDAQGDPDAVWVFKASADLTVDVKRQVLLVNGARAGNVFWSLSASSVLGDQAIFKGNILAGSSITIGTAAALGTTVDGRVLSKTDLHLYASTINTPAP